MAKFCVLSGLTKFRAQYTFLILNIVLDSVLA